MKYNKVILIGMMGSGKSSIANLLSKELNYNLYELDEIFEHQENIKIKDYFSKYGEESFRKIESEILKKSLTKENCVISTGGGVVLNEENRKLIFDKNILTIYLEAKIDTLYERIKNDKTRPLLQNKKPKEKLEEIINKREQFYKKATITIKTDNKTKEEITEEILKIYG